MKLVLALLAATHTAAAFGPARYRASHDPVRRFVPRRLAPALLSATHTAAAFGPAGYRASHDPVSRFVPRSAADECTIVFDADGAFCMEDSHMNRATALDCLATDECDVPDFQEGALRHQ